MFKEGQIITIVFNSGGPLWAQVLDDSGPLVLKVLHGPEYGDPNAALPEKLQDAVIYVRP
jgi:hypothetical protein